MCANGSRSSSHCGKPDSEPIRYSATNPTSTPHATGLNLGASPNNATVTAAESQTAGSCTAALARTIAQFAADVVGSDSVGQSGRQSGNQHRDGRAYQRDRQMACQPTASAYRAAQHRLGSLAGLLLMRPQAQRDGECGRHHAQHAKRHRDEGLLQCTGAAHALDNVVRRAAAELVADAVHDAADQQAVQAQPDGPQQQRAAIQPPGQPERRSAASALRSPDPDVRRSSPHRRRDRQAAGRPVR